MPFIGFTGFCQNYVLKIAFTKLTGLVLVSKVFHMNGWILNIHFEWKIWKAVFLDSLESLESLRIVKFYSKFSQNKIKIENNVFFIYVNGFTVFFDDFILLYPT